MDYKDSFSGSKFQLFERNQKIYIKKFYKNINERDLKSFQKQKDFKSYFIDKYQVESANIEKINSTRKLITLNYYPGLSGSELILNGDIVIHKILNASALARARTAKAFSSPMRSKFAIVCMACPFRIRCGGCCSASSAASAEIAAALPRRYLPSSGDSRAT